MNQFGLHSLPIAAPALPSLVLALLTVLNPQALAAACVEDSAEVVVRVYRFSEGPPAYAFMVINNADAPILTLGIGWGTEPFLALLTSGTCHTGLMAPDQNASDDDAPDSSLLR